jgi:hypothetical protein
MRSSLVKHLWLIQPNENHPPILPLDAAGGATVHFSPAWDVICLRAFLLERTGHTCSLIDTRLFDTLPQAFADAVAETPSGASAMALIYTTTQHIGSAGDIVRYLQQHHPEMPVTLFGPHIASFPETLALLPGVDYGLCGDPEMKLRHLLDALDIPHRLRLVPGLIIPGEAIKAPQWATELRSLSLPDWPGIDWHPYRHDPLIRGAHIEARLSRGHPGTPADAAWPGAGEPLRVWPLDRMARALQRCSGSGINEVFFADPPGFWSDQQLVRWIDQLRILRNTQEWSFQLIARDLPDTIISELSLHGCHRIEMIVPSLNPQHRRELGMTIDEQQLKQLVIRLRNAGVDPQIIFWVEGPWPGESGAATLHDKIKQLGRPSYAVYPFPFHHDAPLYRQLVEAGFQPPPLDAWMAWAQRGAASDPPVAMWGGHEARKRAETTIRDLHRQIGRDPWRTLKKWLPGGDANLRSLLENRALSVWQRVTGQSAGKP